MRRRIISGSDRGIALIVALLVVATLSALGLSLLVTMAIEPRAGANQREAAGVLHAAEAALELAALEVDRIADWSAVLGGAMRADRSDGVPAGTRTLPGGQILDLAALTSQLVCGRSAGCTGASRAASTAERPWGDNNPDWQPFLYGTPAAIGLPNLDAAYLGVWVGDDAMETDGAPETDGDAGEGRMSVRLRAFAWGRGGTRRAIEAVVVRRCEPEGGGERCEAGSRVQSWRSLQGAIP